MKLFGNLTSQGQAPRLRLLAVSALREYAKVPEPVRTRSNDLLTVVQDERVPGARCCVLFSWVEGRFKRRNQLSQTSFDQVGGLMAKLHQHAETGSLPKNFVRPVVRYADLNNKAMLEGLEMSEQFGSKKDAELLRDAYERMLREITEIGRDLGDFNLIHADLHQENYLFHKGNVRAIDFDDCGWGHFMYDIAVSLLEVEHRDDFENLREAFFAGYRRVRPLTTGAESQLSTFFVARRLSLNAWVLGRSDNPELRKFLGTTVPFTVERVKVHYP